MAVTEQRPLRQSRRGFVKGMVTVAGLAAAPGSDAIAQAATRRQESKQAVRQPNIVLYVADQMRWDFVGAYGLNPTVKTPNLDRIFRRGTAFTGTVTNQPLCSPSRACMMTGRYATETGMWSLPPEATLNKDIPTLASILRSRGYTANFIGKWHLAPIKSGNPATKGYVPPEDRGGFLDLFDGANLLASNSHPYGGTIWNSNGDPITWSDEYRADFITERAVRFLKSPQEKPFLLFISQQEPHFQGGGVGVVAPKGYAERYQDPYVPPDLLHLPGNWQAQLPGYYGCIEKIDESVGTILQTLEEQNQLDNTIFLFTSDHGCHFHTRNDEDKRSPHDSSIRVPFLFQGPGFDRSLALPQIIGNIDMTPTFLDSVGVNIPGSMKGKSLLPLIHEPEARRTWEDRALIQISQSMVGRAIRTKEWTYCVAAPHLNGQKVESGMQYEEYVMYNDYSDPAQLVNLVAREPFRKAADELREQLLEMIVASGEPRPTISPARLYP